MSQSSLSLLSSLSSSFIHSFTIHILFKNTKYTTVNRHAQCTEVDQKAQNTHPNHLIRSNKVQCPALCKQCKKCKILHKHYACNARFYARFTQAMQSPKHGSNLMHMRNSSHVIGHFLCTLRSLHKTLHCMLYKHCATCVMPVFHPHVT